MAVSISSVTQWRPRSIIIEASKSQIAKLRKEFPDFDTGRERKIADLTGDYYYIQLKDTEVEVPALLNVVLVSDVTDETERLEKMLDFEDSKQLYEFFEKHKIKIIEDDYSFVRNQKLYEAFNLIERKLRFRAIRIPEIKAVKPLNYRKESLDHSISYFTFSELYEETLLSPASDKFILKMWKNTGGQESELLKLSRKLKKIDEFSFPLNEKELNKLRQIRNQCMHFRVTTPNEYTSAVNLVNKYIRTDEKRLFDKISPVFKQRMEETMRKIQEPSGALRRLLGLDNQVKS